MEISSCHTGSYLMAADLVAVVEDLRINNLPHTRACCLFSFQATIFESIKLNQYSQ